MHIAFALQQQLNTKLFLDTPGCIEELPKAVLSINPARKPILIICDSNTREVAGNRVFSLLSKVFQNTEVMELDRTFGMPIPADYTLVDLIRMRLAQTDMFPVAVGSGTINDLVKRAAYEAESTYISVPTAASIDGYCSSGAALIKNGLKSTLDCPPPVAIIADPEILSTAPPAMTSSGYGDMYAKLAAGMDWILADRLGVESIDPIAWHLVQDDLPKWLQDPAGIFNSESDTFSNLFKGLTYSGYAMQLYHDSRPASGAEHMISHIWEMQHLSKNGYHVSHGYKVALGTVITASLMEQLFSIDPNSFDIEHIVRSRLRWEDRVSQIRKYFPEEPLQGTIIKICHAKWPDDIQLTLRLERFRNHLPEFAQKYKDRLHSSTQVKSQLKKAGCPVSLSDLDIPAHHLHPTLVRAQMIRQRYTVLDILYETALLDHCMAKIEV